MGRRRFCTALLAGLALPSSGRAFGPTVDAIRSTVRGFAQLYSIQVRLGDSLLLAEAPRGPGLDRPANVKSCAKSLVALLLGAAVDRGEIPGVDERLARIAPRLIPARATAGVEDITLEDLVTLRAGLASTSGANYGRWVRSDDWVAHVLSREMTDRPGGRMIYSTGSTHVLGAALAAAAGRSLLAQARERLGEPLGFTVPAWTQDPQGRFLGGNDMSITPRAMLRIATLVRDGGHHEGRAVISTAWLRASLQPRTRSPFSGLDYGYGWFLSASGYAIARGYGGQVIAAHPARRIAVAITSDPERPARSAGYFGELLRLLDGPILALG